MKILSLHRAYCDEHISTQCFVDRSGQCHGESLPKDTASCRYVGHAGEWFNFETYNNSGTYAGIPDNGQGYDLDHWLSDIGDNNHAEN